MDKILCNRYGDLLFRQGEEVALQPGEVRLLVEYALAIPYETIPVIRGRVPGRAFFGRVLETAPDVYSVYEDDGVTVLPCTGSEEAILKLGETVDGCWQTEMVLPAKHLLPLPLDMEPDQGALLAPLAQICEALLQFPHSFGYSLGISGCDFYGCLALSAAKAMGFTPICAIDASEAYRRRAVQYQADFTLNPGNDQAQRRLLNLTEGGLDLVVDMGETPDSLTLSLAGVKEGGTLVLMPVGQDFPWEERHQTLAQERHIRVVRMGFYDAPVSEAATRCALWLLKTRRIETEAIIDRTVTLSALPGAWEDAKMGLVRGAIAVAPEIK